jgi:NADH:ubiquinone oxidoreductase subunit K
VLLSIELMFNAATWRSSRCPGRAASCSGVVLVLFAIAITVAEVAVGLRSCSSLARREDRRPRRPLRAEGLSG